MTETAVIKRSVDAKRDCSDPFLPRASIHGTTILLNKKGNTLRTTSALRILKSKFILESHGRIDYLVEFEEPSKEDFYF